MVITSGVNGLDEMLNRGFPQDEIISVIDPPGSVKTIFSLQFLYNSLAQALK